MDAKLDNLSEISKLLSVKSKMSSDILSLFSKFGFGRLLCRLSLEKHDGISAVQQILSLCLFRINGETIHSIYKKNFYHLLTTGKNCYYRMMVRQAMNWRRLLSYTVLRFECILRKNGIQTESENSCVIFDDTTLEKTGRKLEHITKVFDHVRMNYVLGYKLLLCVPSSYTRYDGTLKWSTRRQKDISDSAHTWGETLMVRLLMQRSATLHIS